MLTFLAALAMTLAAPSEDEILAEMDAFFVALSRADAQALGAMLHEDMVLNTLRKRPGEDGFELIRGDRDQFLRSLEGLAEGAIVELYWDAKVEISPAGLATVWAPYYIEFGGNALHCGIDAFTLVWQDERWVITALHDTRDPSGCERLGLDGARDRMRPEALRPLLKN